jgi:hypothetical protein
VHFDFKKQPFKEVLMRRQGLAEIFCTILIVGLLSFIFFLADEAKAATYAHHYSDFGITGPNASQIVGATTPFTTLEGEAGTLGGGAIKRMLKTIPANAVSSPELEASGRGFAELSTTGAYVSWVNPVDSANAINIRQCIPDGPSGVGIDATLDLYVNGILRQVIPLTSRQTWVYEGNNGNANGMSQTPSTGGPHVFYDESHFLITGEAIHTGDVIMLKKDAENTASFYYIDCIDLESTAPKARPANSLSVADYGATGTSTNDVTGAFNSVCNAARSQHKPVWIPAGKYYVTDFNISSLTVVGAGMWFSTLVMTRGQLQERSDTLRDFCVDATTIVRDQGIGGVNAAGDNYLIERIWAIHSSTAGYWASGNNGTIHSCRSSMCWGDGLNMNNGNSGNHGNNLLAENNFTRGCGDDGATIYSDGSSQLVVGAALRYNTTVSMFWANGLRIAGGKDIRAENNLLFDCVKEAGIYIGVFAAIGNDLDSAIISGNVIVRCGGRRDPAGLAVNAAPGAKLVKVTIANNYIKDALFYGILIGSDRDVITATNNIIDHPAETAIWIQGGSRGTAYFDSMQLINRIPGKLAYRNDAPSTFSVTWGKHNYGMPDTLPVAIAAPVPGIDKNTGLAVVQFEKALQIHYFMPSENGMADVALFNSSGRRIWSGPKTSLNKGVNTIICPTSNFKNGAYIFKITATGGTAGKFQSVNTGTVVLANQK